MNKELERITPNSSAVEQEQSEDGLKEAGRQLDIIKRSVGGDPDHVDQAVGDYTLAAEVAMVDGAPEEIGVAETAELELLEAPTTSPHTAEALNAMPIDSLGPALRALEAGKGMEAAGIVMAALDAASHSMHVAHEGGLATAKSTDDLQGGHGLEGRIDYLPSVHLEGPNSSSAEVLAENDTKFSNYIGTGVTPQKLRELIDYKDMLPDLSVSTVSALLEQVGKIDRDVVGVLLPHLGGATENPDLLAKFYTNPDRIAALRTRNPQLLGAMAETNVRKNGMISNALECYDSIADDFRASRLMHHVDVLRDPKATRFAKNMAGAMIALAPTEEIGEIGYGDIAHGHDESYLPEQNKLMGIPIPLETRMPGYLRQQVVVHEKPIAEMTADEQAMVLKQAYIDKHTQADGSLDTSDVSLADLYGHTQELLLAERLETAAQDAHDRGQIEAQSQKNRDLVERGGPFVDGGDLVHTSHMDFVEGIIDDGLMCGELVVREAGDPRSVDAFPFGVDFYKVRHNDVQGANAIEAISSRVHDGTSVTFIVDRTGDRQARYPDRIASVTDTTEENRHVVVLGAVPSSAFKGIILHGAAGERQVDATRIKQDLVRKKMYVPITSNTGELLFTPAEFDELVQKPIPYAEIDNKLKVHEEYVDKRNPVPPWERADTVLVDDDFI